LIDAAILAHAKPTARLINVARGSVLDQDALLAALDGGRLGFEPEPSPAQHRRWTHPLVRLTPHISSNYTLIRDALFAKLSANLDRFVRGEALADIVDPVEGY
jgi:phosphoglycerate dehydrogenase-like enzyme